MPPGRGSHCSRRKVRVAVQHERAEAKSPPMLQSRNQKAGQCQHGGCLLWRGSGSKARDGCPKRASGEAAPLAKPNLARQSNASGEVASPHHKEIKQSEMSASVASRSARLFYYLQRVCRSLRRHGACKKHVHAAGSSCEKKEGSVRCCCCVFTW